MVQTFADFTGDYNPVHMDEKYCLENGMESRIAHGMLILSFLSTLIRYVFAWAKFCLVVPIYWFYFSCKARIMN